MLWPANKTDHMCLWTEQSLQTSFCSLCTRKTKQSLCCLSSECTSRKRKSMSFVQSASTSDQSCWLDSHCAVMPVSTTDNSVNNNLPCMTAELLTIGDAAWCILCFYTREATPSALIETHARLAEMMLLFFMPGMPRRATFNEKEQTHHQCQCLHYHHCRCCLQQCRHCR